VIVRFAGDSGDGMQLAGSRFTDATALLGMYGRHGESPLPILAPYTPAQCFHAAHAYALSRLADRPTGPTPIGVFRAIDRPVYGAAMTAELEAAHERAGDEQLERLLRGGETWTVS